MLKRWTYIILGVSLLFSCSGSTSKKQEDTAIAENKASGKTQDRKIIAADAQKLVEEVQLKPMILFGKEMNINYEKISQALTNEIPGMMAVLAQKKAVITGSFYIAIKEKPVSGKPCRVFIGIPIKNVVEANGYSTLQVKGGTYIRTLVNAEPGTGLLNHEKTMAMAEKLKFKIDFPFLETYSETRNSDMATVISKATFYYPKIK